jgi:hypothetical protein
MIHVIPSIRGSISRNARITSELVTPMRGINGYNGVLNGRFRSGLLRLSSISDKLTRM